MVIKLSAMDAPLRDAFERALVSGSPPSEPVYAGFSPQTIARTYPTFKLPAVCLVLDWLRREPEEALRALKEAFGIAEPIPLPSSTKPL